MTAARVLRSAGIRVVVVQSGPAGGRHVLATVAEPGLSISDAERLIDGLKHGVGLATLDPAPMSNCATGAIRPPLSPHRLGGRSQVLDLTDLEAIDVLRQRNHVNVFQCLAVCLPKPDRRHRLDTPDATFAARPNGPGNTAGTYASGSKAIQPLATRLFQSGGSFEDVQLEVTHGDSLSGPAQVSVEKHRLAGDLDRWLTKSWASAETFVAQHPPTATKRRPTSDQTLVAKWNDHIDGAGLRTAARRVAMALGNAAKPAAGGLVGMSVRTAADKTGQSKSAAQRGFAQLEARGMIERIADGGSGHGTRYQLISHEQWITDTSGTVCTSPSLGGVGTQTVPALAAAVRLARAIEADVWTPEGLGEGARRVYQGLATAQTPLTAMQVAEFIQGSDRTAHRHLAALRKTGLARQLGGGRWEAEYRDPDEVAFALGVAGVGAARKSRHERERRRDVVRGVEHRLRQRGVEPVPTPPVSAPVDHQTDAAARNRSHLIKKTVIKPHGLIRSGADHRERRTRADVCAMSAATQTQEASS